MVSASDIWKKFIESAGEINNNLDEKERSLGRSFFTWKCKISGDKDFSWADLTRFRILEAVLVLLLDLQIAGVFIDLGKRQAALEPLFNKEEITTDEQSLLEEVNRELLDAFENSLLLLVHKYFTTPKVPNETFVCYPPYRGLHESILLKILELEEEDVGHTDEQSIRYAILRKDLSFIHTILEPGYLITCKLKQTKIFLEEFDAIVVEILSLIYSCLFGDKIMFNLFDERRHAMLENISVFTEKYFSMVSGYDVSNEVLVSVRERNEGKEILLVRAFFTSWGFELEEPSDRSDRIRSRILKYAFEMQLDPWRGLFSELEAWLLKPLLHKDEISKYEKALLEEFGGEILSMLLKVHQFFTIPKLQLYQSAQNDLSPTETNHESLLCFINFLLDVLSRAEYEHIKKPGEEEQTSEESGDEDEEEQTCEESGDEDDEHIIRYIFLIRDELTLLLTILGDINFQFTNHELQQVNHDILLSPFETIAIEIGSLVYSTLFEKLTPTLVDERKDLVVKEISLLNSHMKDHCLKVSDLYPRSVASRSTSPLDSLFVVDSLIQDLENLIESQVDFTIDDMVDQVNILQQELCLSMSLLRDIYKVPQHIDMDELFRKTPLTKIRDVAYEAEYLVNSHVVGKAPIWYLKIRLPSVISNIQITNSTLQDISKICGNNSKAIKYFNQKALSQPVISSGVGDNHVVGFEENKTMILNDLIRGPVSLTTVCICGMAGLGKTTTTRKLYQSRSVYSHFDIRAWCVVSQAYDKRRVLIQILMSLEPQRSVDDVRNLTDEEIGLQIHKSLSGRRYLIVIDDVWQPSTLDDLRIYFPDHANRSRILLTTRNQNVAPTRCIPRSLSLLSNDQSWELLKDKVFLNEFCPSQLLTIGKAIAANCRGLPLALVVTAGILASFEREQYVWERLKNKLDVYMLDDVNGYRSILELSFEHLSNHLKLCFLYLAIFPEDTEIQTKKLISMWIAERFIPRTAEKEPEDVGKEYLEDLISRSLLVIARRGSDGEIKACTIHDSLRDMCVKRALEEKFIKYIKRDGFPIYGEHKCLVFHSESSKWRYLPQYGRTFVGHVSEISGFGFCRMPLLRVMDTPRRYSRGVPNPLVIPNQLRYLTFGRMPKSEEGYFSNLEFLHVQSNNFVIIPPFILKIAKLRHLHVEHCGQFDGDYEISRTNTLRYLSQVIIKNKKDMEILRCSPHLRRLKCIWFGRDLDFCFFNELESLTVFRGHSYKFREIRFPPTIKKLHLCEIMLPWEKMSIVGELPNLIVLKLSQNAFVGEEWNTTEGEFLELKFLKIDCIERLKWWNSCSEHFPKLEHLVLYNPRQLKEIPRDFGCLSTLQKIEVISCEEILNKSAASIGEEQHGYGNKDFQVIIRER